MKELQSNPSCEANPFASENWPFPRVSLSLGVETNTFMFRLTLSSGLSRRGCLSSGWPLERGSTVYHLNECTCKYIYQLYSKDLGQSPPSCSVFYSEKQSSWLP